MTTRCNDTAAGPLSVDDFLARAAVGHRRAGLPRTLSGWLTTTDHKAIGIAYAVTALVFLAIGGILAGIIRAELTQPGMQFVDRGDLQQRVHHPRQRDGLPVRRPVRLRPRQLPDPPADRRARPGVPPSQRPVLLAVPVRWRHHAARLRDRRRRGQLRLDGLPAAVRPDRDARARRRPVDRRRHPHRHVRHAQRGQRHHHRLHAAGARA